MDYDPNGEAMAPEADAPDPTHRLDTGEVYPDAHRAAVAVLEAAAFQHLSREGADRWVSLVLGAALLELERPWRLAVDNARTHVHHLEEALLDADRRIEHLIGQRDRAQTAYLHVGEVEHDQRQRADDLEIALRAAEAEREAARDLAVHLEGEAALLTTLAGSVDREWLRRWATSPDDDGTNAYAAQMATAARIVLAEVGETIPQETDR